MSEPRLQGKSHDIPKRLIWAAWLKVKSNGGAAGADGVTIVQFEARLKDSLFKLWNRMSSGSYFPGPVRAVEIPKKGGTRVLGIPNVVDRVAQSAAVLALEPSVEKVFHDDSYGYRPGRSPEDAVRVCRKRCLQRDWVVDLDVKAFFDSVPWDLMLKAVARHTDQKWVLLYVERWLQAPVAIEKAHGGGTRILGVPTVADRIAQTVVAVELEKKVEQIFHPDSYGYRPKRSALDAVATCRARCWKTNWVIDLDIRKFFDSLPWRLVVKAVEANTDLPWVVLYVKRWLQAPLALPDGSLQIRDRGTPQGSAVSPVLANLFLHVCHEC